MILRIDEAFIRAKRDGNAIKKKDLAAKVWPDSRPEAQKQNMANLINGVTRRVDPEWIVVICKELNCTADFLFGLKNE